MLLYYEHFKREGKCLSVCVHVCLINWLFIMRRCQTSNLSHQVPCLLVFLLDSLNLTINYGALINLVHATVYFLCVYACVHVSVSVGAHA